MRRAARGTGLVQLRRMRKRLGFLLVVTLLSFGAAAMSGCDPETAPTACILLPSAC